MPRRILGSASLAVCIILITGLSFASDDYPILKRSDQFFGKVISGTSERILLADQDLIILDFGTQEGANPDDVYAIYEPNLTLKTDNQGRKIFEKVGEVTIVKVFEEKSVGRITESLKEIDMASIDFVYYVDPLRLVETGETQQMDVIEPYVPPAVVEQGAYQPAEQVASTPSEMVESETIEKTMEADAAAFEEELVYFAYDDSGLTESSIALIKEKAAFLMANPDIKTVLEGHCDERGSVEYNLALGERRAKSVRDFMVQDGVAPGRIRMVSYGKERPADPGHTEEAWAKNRRCQFVIE